MSDTSHEQTQEEFLASYDEFSDAIFRFCVLKVSNREVAVDLMQDTFTKTWDYVAKGNTILVSNSKQLDYRLLSEKEERFA